MDESRLYTELRAAFDAGVQQGDDGFAGQPRELDEAFAVHLEQRMRHYSNRTFTALYTALMNGRSEHLIEYHDGGWTLMHPESCRPNLFECPVNRAAEQQVTGCPEILGVFESWLNEMGDLMVGDRVENVGSYTFETGDDDE